MPNVPNSPRRPDASPKDTQDFSTVSIPRITPEMIEQAKQETAAEPKPETQWEQDRAAAQRAAQSSSRRRGRSRGFNPFASNGPTLTPRTAAKTERSVSYTPNSPAKKAPPPKQPVERTPEASESIAQFFASYVPPATTVTTTTEAGDTTMTFILPEAYRLPTPQQTPVTAPAPPPIAPPAPPTPAVQQTPPAPPPRPVTKPAPPEARRPETPPAPEPTRPEPTPIPRPRPIPQPPAREEAAQDAQTQPPQDAAGADPALTATIQAPGLAALLDDTPSTPATSTRPNRRTRAQAEAALYQSIHDDHLWLNNPVMVRGLGLAPAIVAVTSGGTALQFCMAAVLMLTATRALAVALCHLFGKRQRPLLYALSAALVYVPAYCVLYAMYGADLNLLGIYLPLLVADPVIIKRMEAQELESVGQAFARGINNTLGLCVAFVLVGMLRELLGAGSLFGIPVLDRMLLPLASQPAGGFMLVGLLAAVWTAVGGSYVHFKQEEVRHLYAERK